ncbi:hypothetical protein WJX73_002075 [Symbiochloris irregularis]|uniref:S1 motif domain-containing protein n=1 Tax=Symbiochloris irregularis TaxID=706552 RepID=A0AAW1P7N7_9CHLO
MAVEEDAFPRGGGRALSGLERKRFRQEAEADARRDFLGEWQEGSTAKRRKGHEDEDVPSAVTGKLPEYIELLRYKRLAVGAKVWGSIAIVRPNEIIVSLPHGLRAKIAPSEASNGLAEAVSKGGPKQLLAPVAPLSQLFHVGQKVAGIILSIGDATSEDAGSNSGAKSSKDVTLSLRLSRLCSGVPAGAVARVGACVPSCVVSTEDHGYLMDLGIKGLTGFLPFNACDKSNNGASSTGATLKPGQLVQAVVTNADSPAMLHLSTEHAAVAPAVVAQHEALDMDALLPGSLVSVRIKHLAADGLLVSFLSFFQGTIDAFHLREAGDVGELGARYRKGQKVRARVLYIDPAEKRVCLSLRPHLIGLQAHPASPAQGSVIQEAIVQRVDNALGAVLTLPPSDPKEAAEETSSTAFVHVSNVSDKRTDRLDKALKIGSKVKARVTGSRPFEGLAVVSLKESVVTRGVDGLEGVVPGGLVQGSVVSVEESGLRVSLGGTLKALVPWVHTSNLPGQHARKRLKPGQSISARILEVKPSSRRVSLTFKRALFNSKLPIIASWEDVRVGMRSHGMVTGVQEWGVFVGFCGGLAGLAPAAELGLAAGQDPSTAFQIGQVVKARVLSADASSNRLRLSLAPSHASTGAADADGDAEAENIPTLSPGDLCTGVVSSIVRAEAKDGSLKPPRYALALSVEGSSATVPGVLEADHLSDHPSGSAALAEVLQVGDSLGTLLVLEQLEGQAVPKVSRKASLIAAAPSLPSTLDGVQIGQVHPGVVSSVTDDSVFVRFLQGLTGRAGLTQLADIFVSDPHSHYTRGQSVRAQIASTDPATGRMGLNLRPSATASADAGLLASYFRDLETAEALRASREADAAALVDWSQLSIGGPAAGAVHEVQPYGILYDLEAHPDLVGLISSAQQEDGRDASEGRVLPVRVLDINKHDGIVDLTTLSSLVSAEASTEERAAQQENAVAKLEEGQKVKARIELVRAEYVVVSVSGQGSAVGCAATQAWNQRSLDPHARFRPGQTVSATIAALPSPDTGDRLLLTLPLDAAPLSAATQNGVGDKERLHAGGIVKGTVAVVNPLDVEVHLPRGQRGRVHVTEVEDGARLLNPLARFSVGDSVEAVCLGRCEASSRQFSDVWELSTRDSMRAAAAKGKGVKDLVRSAARLRDLKSGTLVNGFIAEVQDSFAWVALGRSRRARLHALDASKGAREIADFSSRFKVGQPVQCCILRMDRHSKQIDLSSGPHLDAQQATADTPDAAKPQPAGPGSVVNASIAHVSGSGVRLQLGHRGTGLAALTDLHDGWVDNALEGLKVGAVVKALLLPLPAGKSAGKKHRASATAPLPVSLAPSLVRKASKQQPASNDVIKGLQPNFAAATDLKQGQQVEGYVRAASQAGVFVTLARGLEARVRLANLSEGYVEDPVGSFPAGKHVKGWVLSCAANRVEVSLKPLRRGWPDLDPDMAPGHTVRGVVKRVEPFGVFIELSGMGVTGMAHVSELADDFVKTPADAFQPGQSVRAKVLVLDRDKQRLSLGLKASYFQDADDNDPDGASDSDQGLDEEMAELAEADDSSDESDWRAAGEAAGADDASDSQLESQGGNSGDSEDDSDEDDDSDAEDDDDVSMEGEAAGGVMAEAGADMHMASVGWGDESDDEDIIAPPSAAPGPAVAAAAEEAAPALTKRRRQKLKKQAEAEEEARRSQLIPKSVAELEKAVQAQPDNGYAWIQYMAQHISEGDVAQARAVAERALQTINFRAEAEKRGVWVAWINMEAHYGDPPGEAAMGVFHRALPYNNPKALHLSLLHVLERAQQTELLEQMHKVVTKKFSGSAKAWLTNLRYCIEHDQQPAVQSLLQKALAVLPKHKHIKVLTQTALAHFKSGTSAEQGRNIFESILRNYPKRLDLWNVCIDQEVKAGDHARVRALLLRATHAELPPKKMKALFKRSLEFEQAHGDEATVAAVQQAAQQYVDEHLGA